MPLDMLRTRNVDFLQIVKFVDSKSIGKGNRSYLYGQENFTFTIKHNFEVGKGKTRLCKALNHLNTSYGIYSQIYFPHR